LASSRGNEDFTLRDAGGILEDLVGAFDDVKKAIVVADIANVELYLGIGSADQHVFLLLLISNENTDSRMSVLRMRRRTALPNDPLLPVMSKVLQLNI
jgi:hypothetical protein